MNTPMIKTTVKLIEGLRNSKGEYSEKNKALKEILECALSLKGIGCNFIVNREYGKDGVYIARDDKTYVNHDPSRMIKEGELSNLLTCLSLTLTDRAFVVSYNKDNQICIVCISIQKFPKEFFTREKGIITSTSITCFNAIDGSKVEMITNQKKGVRPLNDMDISNLKSVFNSEFGLNYNKEIAIAIKKDKKENIA